MNHIADSTFRGIVDRTVCHNTNILISPDWWIKTTDGGMSCFASRVDTGVQIDAYYPELGYIYVRQEIPDVLRFSGGRYALRAKIDRVSWQDLYCDVYIQAKLNADGSRRALVIDTGSMALARGENVIQVPIQVPDLSNEVIESGNSLQLAVRLIGQEQNTQTIVNSVELLDTAQDVTINDEQLAALIAKISELHK